MKNNGQKNIDILAAWQTSNRVSEFFIENLPAGLWTSKVPGATQKTIAMISGHIHNARCMWIKMVGKQYGVSPPKSVDRRRVTKKALLRALKQSNKAILQLLGASLKHDGLLRMNIPWANIPPDVIHFTCYLIAHEAHHRGQIVLCARQLGHRLPADVTSGLWQWKTRRQEAQYSYRS